jgi:phytoene/squalene synthetase
MKPETLKLAKSITWSASRQAYLTARLFVDRGRVDDFYLAFGYFRWLDDAVDDPAVDQEKRLVLIGRQVNLVAKLFRNELPSELSLHEEMVAQFIRRGDGTSKRLKPFIDNMLATIEFDAKRRGQLISQNELDEYCVRLAASVVDGLQYFIGSRYEYPDNKYRLTAATAAQITHLLRDTFQDLEDGIINIPMEYIEENNLDPSSVESPRYREWVKHRVELASKYFSEGKQYFDHVGGVRLKMAGLWYCTRFERVLRVIENDEYILRNEYLERRNLDVWVKFGWVAFVATLQHVFRVVFRLRRV